MSLNMWDRRGICGVNLVGGRRVPSNCSLKCATGVFSVVPVLPANSAQRSAQVIHLTVIVRHRNNLVAQPCAQLVFLFFPFCNEEICTPNCK
jgi:hypothetical protein